jgi:hypothetical protein
MCDILSSKKLANAILGTAALSSAHLPFTATFNYHAPGFAVRTIA